MPAQIPWWWKCSSWWSMSKKSCWRQIWRVLHILRGERGGLDNQCSLLFPSCPPKKLCNSWLLNDLLAICHTLQTTMLQIKKRWSTKIWPVLHILRGGRGGLGKQCSLSLPYPEKLVFIFWLLNDLFIIFYYWWPFPFICKVHCCRLIRGFWRAIKFMVTNMASVTHFEGGGRGGPANQCSLPSLFQRKIFAIFDFLPSTMLQIKEKLLR